MTDNEIIKALECCKGYLTNDCATCKNVEKYPRCNEFLNEIALDLINRQKAEIERLKDELHRAKVEISKHFDYMDEATNESLEVFADSLKIKLNRTIDNLLKEMAGDTK